jgi:lauroyl/myristoyl acyltransferase
MSEQVPERPYPRGRRRRRRRKSRVSSFCLKHLEFFGVGLVHSLFSYVPPRRLAGPLAILGRLFFRFAARRRRVTLQNLQYYYQGKKNDEELWSIARRSLGSFLLSMAEHSWFRRLLADPARADRLKDEIAGLDKFMAKARDLHRQTKGCIFVTPHFGAFGIFPYLFSAWTIPLVVPIQPRRNTAVQQRWCPLNVQRSHDGEMFVAKNNSFGALKAALHGGRSVGMMADQRTVGGVAADFLGRAAPTTPMPALLAISFRRPIVVGGCYRTGGRYGYAVFMTEPVWPPEGGKLQPNIVRMTEEMNRRMGEIIALDPEQYFWVHNRWKPDSRNAAFSPRARQADNDD